MAVDFGWIVWSIARSAGPKVDEQVRQVLVMSVCMIPETCSSAQEIDSKGSSKEGFGRMADSSRLLARYGKKEKTREGFERV